MYPITKTIGQFIPPIITGELLFPISKTFLSTSFLTIHLTSIVKRINVYSWLPKEGDTFKVSSSFTSNSPIQKCTFIKITILRVVHPLFNRNFLRLFKENPLTDKNIPRPSDVKEHQYDDICINKTFSFKSTRSSTVKPTREKTKWIKT